MPFPPSEWHHENHEQRDIDEGRQQNLWFWPDDENTGDGTDEDEQDRDDGYANPQGSCPAAEIRDNQSHNFWRVR
jgi:hypothetical protein